MEKKSIFSTLFDWLRSTEMFARPSKKIPGKWQLYEYYTEPDKKLVNIKEKQLIKENLFFEIGFYDKGKYAQKTNLSIPIISHIENGTWSISKNYITLIHPEDFRKNIEFQFAFENGNLKLLNRDTLGKIEFFGFFRREDSK